MMLRTALLALSLTACGPSGDGFPWRSVVASTLRVGGFGALVAHVDGQREASLAACVSTRVLADVLPGVADAVLADGEVVALSTDPTACLELHGVEPVEVGGPLVRAAASGLLAGVLSDLAADPAIAADCHAAAWLDAASVSVPAVLGDVLSAVAREGAPVVVSWASPVGVCGG